MIKKYPLRKLLFLFVSASIALVASCKKDSTTSGGSGGGTTTVVPAVATPTKLGIYESDSSIYKLLFIGISKVGTVPVNYGLIFDTGSGGMVLDANGVIPASMITSTGFKFTGDSTVINGITITSETATIEYGDDDASVTKVYGNLAYASVTIGETDGNIVVARLPFFLYYKGVDNNNNTLPQHYFDVLGVSPQYDMSFSNGAFITSPFSYFNPGNGLTKGFKMAALGTSGFSLDGNYVPGVVTLGLTAADLSTTSGFTMNSLVFVPGGGYYPVFAGTINYNAKNVSAEVLFDTGTEPYNYIEDPAATGTTLLAKNTAVALTLSSGFKLNYSVTATDNLTYVENPGTTGGQVTIMCLEFFLNNEYMINFSTNQLGLKNN